MRLIRMVVVQYVSAGTEGAERTPTSEWCDEGLTSDARCVVFLPSWCTAPYSGRSVTAAGCIDLAASRSPPDGARMIRLRMLTALCDSLSLFRFAARDTAEAAAAQAVDLPEQLAPLV